MKALQTVLTLIFFLFTSQVYSSQKRTDYQNEVDVMIVLATDWSGSIQTDERELIQAGYAKAIRSREVVREITNGMLGRIAIAYVRWGSKDEFKVVVDWTIISDKTSAERFAQEIEQANIHPGFDSTSISVGLQKSTDFIEKAPFFARKNVIDLLADGQNNDGPKLSKIRAAILEHGVTVNGIPLLYKASNERYGKLTGKEALHEYFKDCVIGGTGSFMRPVESPEEFAEVFRQKLLLEIVGLPPPSLLHKAMFSPQPNRKKHCG